MSDHKTNNIYSKAIPFMIVAFIVVIIGTIVMVFVPLTTKAMHPKLDGLKPYTALQLAGRNIYQHEGCVNCHSQMIRPLKADVLRYGAYSKAGENYYERPFLWGSKRTGPDLAREGGKYPDGWHVAHFMNPRSMFPKSNMPKYDWFATKPIDVKETIASMDTLKFPYTPEDIKDLKSKKEMDAVIAYMQMLGTDVPVHNILSDADMNKYMKATNPLAGNKDAIKKGKLFFATNCFMCHGKEGKGGDIALAMKDLVTSDIPDGQLFVSVANGLQGMMPSFLNTSTKKQIWSVLAYVRDVANKAQAAEKNNQK